MIKSFTNKAAYDAATKPTTEASVSLIEASSAIVVDGMNIPITNNPKVGDILVLNESNEKIYIPLESYRAGVLPSAYTIVGVVAQRQGKQVTIVHKTNEAKVWAAVFIWELSGTTMTDGESHTQDFTANSVSVSVTWQTSTLSAFATALNTALSGQSFGGHTYRAIYDSTASKVKVICDTYSTLNTFKEPTMSGITFTRAIGEGIGTNSTGYRKSGKSVYWGAVNAVRYAEYSKTSGIVPTADVPVGISTSDNAVKYTEFCTNAYCAAIRAAYCADASNPTEADYLNYITEEFSIAWPDGRASMASAYRDGKAFTALLKDVTYPAADGTNKILYPAANYCGGIGYNSEGIEAGDWYLPSKWEMAPIWSMLTYGHSGVTRAGADAINRGLNAIGGSAISCTLSAWSSALCYAGNAWSYNSGSFSSNSFYRSYRCVPFALLTLPD